MGSALEFMKKYEEGRTGTMSKIIGFMLLHSDNDKEYYNPHLSKQDEKLIFQILDKYGDSNESLRGELEVIEKGE